MVTMLPLILMLTTVESAEAVRRLRSHDGVFVHIGMVIMVVCLLILLVLIGFFIIKKSIR
jgi:hypothetical protein